MSLHGILLIARGHAPYASQQEMLHSIYLILKGSCRPAKNQETKILNVYTPHSILETAILNVIFSFCCVEQHRFYKSFSNIFAMQRFYSCTINTSAKQGNITPTRDRAMAGAKFQKCGVSNMKILIEVSSELSFENA